LPASSGGDCHAVRKFRDRVVPDSGKAAVPGKIPPPNSDFANQNPSRGFGAAVVF
jgi:hypothetical protein